MREPGHFGFAATSLATQDAVDDFILHGQLAGSGGLDFYEPRRVVISSPRKLEVVAIAISSCTRANLTSALSVTKLDPLRGR